MIMFGIVGKVGATFATIPDPVIGMYRYVSNTGHISEASCTEAIFYIKNKEKTLSFSILISFDAQKKTYALIIDSVRHRQVQTPAFSPITSSSG